MANRQQRRHPIHPALPISVCSKTRIKDRDIRKPPRISTKKAKLYNRRLSNEKFF